jgi:hypothetical protein
MFYRSMGEWHLLAAVQAPHLFFDREFLVSLRSVGLQEVG